jgi:hypothetical protein
MDSKKLLVKKMNLMKMVNQKQEKKSFILQGAFTKKKSTRKIKGPMLTLNGYMSATTK